MFTSHHIANRCAPAGKNPVWLPLPYRGESQKGQMSDVNITRTLCFEPLQAFPDP